VPRTTLTPSSYWVEDLFMVPKSRTWCPKCKLLFSLARSVCPKCKGTLKVKWSAYARSKGAARPKMRGKS